jgi:hypothetical protein
MRTDIDLDAAAGVIGEDQAIALRNFQAERDGMSGATSEKFQLFGGYADLVIAIGMAMVLVAVAIFVGSFARPNNLGGSITAIIPCAGTAAALVNLTRRINLKASPAMALVLTAGFAGFSFMTILLALVVFAIGFTVNGKEGEQVFLIIAVTIHIAVMRVHWRRFRFPPTLAMITAGYAFVALAIVHEMADFATRGPMSAAVALLIATGTMIAGIWWDLTDIRRETERSQVAFWLHCLAGVLMSRALFSLLTGTTIDNGQMILTGLSLDQFPWVLAMVLGAALISLLLDRRSLLVGCLLPTVGIFDKVADGTIAAITGLMLAGTALIYFSTNWVRLRTGLLALLPDRIAAQLPRTSLIAQGQRPTRRRKELWRLR